MLNALLPVILTYATTFEGSISGSVVQASLFSKLAAFMIIQTFFVSAITGSVAQEIQRIVNNPTSFMDLLATSLPAQSTFFIQTVFVYSITTFITEGLGLARIFMGVLRTFIGPNLTDRERKKEHMFLRPLAEPKDFEYGNNMSLLVLIFMVYLVYAVIAPLVSFVSAFCFGLLEALFRHQFVYVYRSKPDSGGRLWMNFMKILTVCMLIAELTVVGMMALKKTAMSTLCFPLVVVSLIFAIYLRERHFDVALNLPTRLCLKQDRRNRELDFSFVKDAYLQPEMREKDAQPNLPPRRLEQLELNQKHYTEETIEEEKDVEDVLLSTIQSVDENRNHRMEETIEEEEKEEEEDVMSTIQSADENGTSTFQTTGPSGVNCRITKLELPSGVFAEDNSFANSDEANRII